MIVRNSALTMKLQVAVNLDVVKETTLATVNVLISAKINAHTAVVITAVTEVHTLHLTNNWGIGRRFAACPLSNVMRQKKTKF